jgi:hypothetical protein
MDSKRVWEVALTVLVAIFLLVAAEGKHSYGFYMALRRLQRWAGSIGLFGCIRPGHGAGCGLSWLSLSCLTRSCRSGCTGSTGSQSTWFSACCFLDGQVIGSGAHDTEHGNKAAQVISLGTGPGSRYVCGETSYRPARENDSVRHLLEVT